MALPLDYLLDTEENKYKKAIASIRRVEQIAQSDLFDELKKSGQKLSIVALSQVLNNEVELSFDEDISEKS